MRLELTRLVGAATCVLALGGCLDLYLIARSGGSTTSGGVVAGATSSFLPSSSSSTTGTTTSGVATSSPASAASSGGATSALSTNDPSSGTSASLGPPGATTCQEQCVVPSDCLADFSCVNGRCVYSLTPPPCVEDGECVILFTGWTVDCMDDSGCSSGYACIDVNGGGRCALLASPAVDNCAPAGWTAMGYTSRQDAGVVQVCAEQRAQCVGGTCRLRCLGDNHCSTSEFPFCNTTTGSCECLAGTCSTNASVCLNGVCQCQLDGDCLRGNVDRCFSGVCGCSSTAACTTLRSHPNTSYVCD